MSDYRIQRYHDGLAIVWHQDGKRRRHSLGTADRSSAESAARAFWQRREIGGEAHTVGEAVRAYLKAKKAMLSIKRAEVAWKAAEGFWDKLPIARVDIKAAEDYRTRRAHCRAITVRNELAVIRAALNWAAKHKMIGAAPFIQMPKLPASKVGYLSKPDFRKLVDGAGRPHVALFMKLAVATGARSNALLDLTWDQVDFRSGLITLNPEDRVQTSKYRATVPMNAQFRAILKEAKEGVLTPFVIEYGLSKVGSIKKGFAACTRAKVKATPHMLRHSAAVWMAEAGGRWCKSRSFWGTRIAASPSASTPASRRRSSRMLRRP